MPKTSRLFDMFRRACRTIDKKGISKSRHLHSISSAARPDEAQRFRIAGEVRNDKVYFIAPEALFGVFTKDLGATIFVGESTNKGRGVRMGSSGPLSLREKLAYEI